MADVSVTPSLVVPTNTTTIAQGIAGATITAGQALYMDTTAGNQLKPCIATGTALQALCVGIALHGATVGQPIRYATGGDLTLNGMAVAGIYCVSTNAGGLAPVSDLQATHGTNQATVIGAANSATNLKIAIQATGVQNP